MPLCMQLKAQKTAKIECKYGTKGSGGREKNNIFFSWVCLRENSKMLSFSLCEKGQAKESSSAFAAKWLKAELKASHNTIY